MATPSLRRSTNRTRHSGQERFQPPPLVTRRFAAWSVEVSLVVASVLIPFGIGIYTQSQFAGEQVPLNPVLAAIVKALARTLTLPIGVGSSNVAPLTNLFWSVALVAPIVLTVWQLYLLAKTGSTLPKRWFGVRVVTAALKPPGMRRALLREGIGCWGLPLLFAYLLWFYSGAFPSLGILAGVSCLMVLAEGMSARFHPQRRCLHDRLAGTYVLDANRPVPEGVQQGVKSSGGRFVSRNYQQTEVDEEAAIAGIVLTPKLKQRRRSWWRWMRQHPHFTVLLVALFGMATVLGTLVSTQIYIQTQANQRAFEQHNNQQFLTLMAQLSPNSPATLEERQRAILALGTLKDPQALEFLVNLLGQETNSTLLAQEQQALVNSGLKALPDLQRLNQSLDGRYSVMQQEQALRIERLQATQWAIAKILMIDSGKLHTVDLSRTNLGRTDTESGSFTLVLDKIDLSGIQLRAANLNHASFRGSQFRGPGEDSRWDTPDDWIADLSDAQMKAANLTSANLSRVLMERTNLVLATLNQADLSYASLTGANLSSAKLVGANLHAAVLADTSLTGADLGETNLTQANLYAARLSQVSALGTKLQFANLTQSDWRGSDLSQADLSHTNLLNANLSDTRLTGANFRNAQMGNINLRNADLSLADLRGANLAGADLQGTIFASSKPAQEQQFRQTNPSSSQFTLIRGVDFSQVKNLDTKQIAYICTQGGNHPRCP